MNLEEFRGKGKLTSKWKAADMQKHKQNLKRARSLIDNKPPKQYSHIRNNCKKSRIQEERHTEIERENRILLEKIRGIMTSKATNNIVCTRKSLNKQVRLKRLKEISEENQKMLKRLKEKKSGFRFEKLENEQLRIESRNSSFSRISNKRGTTTPLQSRGLMSSYSKNTTSRIPKRTAPLTSVAEKTLVFSDFLKIDDCNYLVEMKKSKRFLEIFVKGESKVFKLNVPNGFMYGLIEEGDYYSLSRMLTIRGNDLVILDEETTNMIESRLPPLKSTTPT